MDDGRTWKRMSFKGNKVWAAQDGTGAFVTQKGKVLIKYNLDQDYEYWISAANLKPEDQAVPAAPEKKESKKRTKKTKGKPEAGQGNQPDDPVLSENCIRIYTDGASSGNPGPSGIGAVLIYKENRKEISEYIGHATNNIAELTAIHRALSALKRRDLPVRIFTDSSYAVGLLSQEWKPRASRELVHEIRELIKGFSDIRLVKVAGHAGIKENEVADFLAVSAVKKATSGPEKGCPG